MCMRQLTLNDCTQTSAIILSHVRTLPTVAAEAACRGIFRLHRRRGLVTSLQYRPIQPVPVIRQHPKEPRRDLSLLRWGLISTWAKDTSGAARMINARSETAHTLPAFREAMKLRRCLVPADGFYEWVRREVCMCDCPAASIPRNLSVRFQLCTGV
jgi:putative SOS response-associated peptidase YedK